MPRTLFAVHSQTNVVSGSNELTSCWQTHVVRRSLACPRTGSTTLSLFRRSATGIIGRFGADGLSSGSKSKRRFAEIGWRHLINELDDAVLPSLSYFQ
jgi:hypothetical protein